MAYEREAQTDLAELQRLAAGRVETDPPSGYERDAQSDVMELGRLARDLSESDPAAGGYERVGQTDIAVLRRKLIGGTVVIPPATGYSLAGPSSGNVGVASTNFTVTLTPAGGTVVGTVTVTPSDGGGGGTFTPSTVGLTTVAPSATFTYTPASVGAKTISTTNSGGLTNPGNLTYTAAAVGLADGDPVSSWPDSSGNGHTATNTGSARPTFKTNIVNGKPVVRFASASSTILNIASPPSGASPWTVLAVMKAQNNVTVLGSIGEAGAITGPFENSDGTLYVINRSNYYAHFTTGFGSAFHVLTGLSNGIGVPLVFADGTSYGSSGSGAAANSGNWLQIAGIGSDGDLAEVLLYNSDLGVTDRANLEKYLGTKYGITVAGGTAVDPSTVAGLVGWWKADSLLPPVTPPALVDGDPVSLWPDKSFGGHDASNTGTARPTFKTNIINGKPVVRFTAAALSGLNIASAVSAAEPWTVLVVVKPATPTSQHFSLINTTTVNPSGPFFFSSGTVLYIGDRAGIYNAGAAPYATAFHIHRVHMGVAGPTAYITDGASIIGGGGALTPNANPGGNFNTIGAQGTNYSDGDIAEIIVYNVNLNGATDGINLDKYLGVKYGITVPAGSAVQPDTIPGLVAWWKADSLRPAGVYLLDNLISYWKLDEASGTRNDSQSTNHLAATNAPVGVAGKINNGCQFVTGSSQRLSVASSSALQVTSDFTFSFWLKLNTLAAGNPAVLGKDNTAAPSDYGFYPHATAGLVFWVGDPNLYAVAVGSAPSTGVWYHVVGWYDSSDTKLRLRINDTTTFVSSMTCVLASTAAQFWIGAGNYTGFAQYADCVVDEVGFWKRVLTAAEITALYNGGAGLPYTSFVA